MQLSLRARMTWMAHLYKALTQQHHKGMATAFAAVLAPDAVVIEAGGHAGQFTKLLSRAVPGGQVLVFEPGSYALSILRRVTRWRCASNVRVTQAGLGAAEDVLELSVPVKKSGSLGFGLSHFGGGDGGRPVRTEKVRQTTVDDIVATHALPRVDLIKADIEGWEMRLLTGAKSTLDRFLPTLYLEINDAHLARAGDDAAALWALLEPMGYRPFTFDEHSGRFAPCPPGVPQGDIWFVNADTEKRLPR